uniref:Cytochrome b6-f complex subunit VII n=1 Tax=Cyanidiococcus yangmingshanensis TaxID=2690220 RepID=A0A7G5VUJ6_9RHOD|nr:cytochrome b6-f complex subunit VII [Cyanidiococcus yangmingshanensis]QMX77363.1 cytochrome b6-f complex subunit VII [Cyanidiococcus yangmingshanensis]UNJ15978.1 cytochrome B6-f complex subunit [Cyanidioschyzonaceae sp. 3]WDB00329.1 cytochrome b6-f complex subunit VII [Cyanidiococcus yangmingshanensis]
MNEILILMIICPLLVMVGLGMGFALLWLQP